MPKIWIFRPFSNFNNSKARSCPGLKFWGNANQHLHSNRSKNYIPVLSGFWDIWHFVDHVFWRKKFFKISKCLILCSMTTNLAIKILNNVFWSWIYFKLKFKRSLLYLKKQKSYTHLFLTLIFQFFLKKADFRHFSKSPILGHFWT